MDEVAQVRLPTVLVDKSEVMVGNVELENNKVPSAVCDQLRLDHGVDVTGLKSSSTPNGNTYRSYVLMCLGNQ